MMPQVIKSFLIIALMIELPHAIGHVLSHEEKSTELIQTDRMPHLQLTPIKGPFKPIILNADVEQRKGKELVPLMEMLDPRKHPKPKPPMGNDIGIARIRSLPHDALLPTTLDRMEATVSIGYSMDAKNDSQKGENEEEKVVSRELHEIMDSVPTMPIPNFEFQKDQEQEAINQRITEVARQLTEAALRKEYENGELRKVLPLPQDIPRSNNQITEGSTSTSSDRKSSNSEKETSVTEAIDDITTQQLKLMAPLSSTKLGKSLDISKAQPLISHMPQEAHNMQLIQDVQSVPYMMLSEGFLSSAELIGPLLGGPPISRDGITIHRMPKNLPAPELPQQPNPFKTVNLPNFLRIVSPRYKFSSNDLVVSVPVSGGVLPAIITGKNTWWTDPSYKEIFERKSTN